MKLRIKIEEDKLISAFLCMILSWNSALISLAVIARHINRYWIFTTAKNIFTVVFVLLFVYSSFRLRKKQQLIFATFIIIWILTLLVSYSSLKQYMWTSFNDLTGNPFYGLFFFAVIGFVVMDRVYNVSLLCRSLEITGYVVIVLALLNYIIHQVENEYLEYMTYSYNILFFTVFLLIYNFFEFKLMRLLCGGVGAVLLLLVGCRGAMLSLFICVALASFLIGKISWKKQMLLLCISLLAIYTVFNLSALVAVLSDYLQKNLGVQSRILRLYLLGLGADSSGRIDIYEKVLQRSAVIGKGLYGDRIILGGYAHNLFIEWIFEFGWILGLIISIAFISFIILSIKRSKNVERVLLVALLSTGFFKLLLSGSWLNCEPGFYCLVGFCYNYLLNNAKHKNLK